jgi:predicted RecB family nuclease
MLWLSINEPDLAGETDEATQHLYDVGHTVGEYARLRFAGGMLVTEDHMHMAQAIKSTEALVKSGAPVIFEATARYDKLQSRVDILKRVRKDGDEWDIYEVKMSTSVKDEHLDDVAIQRYCFEKAGYKIRKTFLVHINTGYIRHGDIDVRELFLEEDITQQVLEKMTDMPQKVKELVAVLASASCPEAEPGDQCYTPYECAFLENCIKPPPEYSIEPRVLGTQRGRGEANGTAIK